MASFRFSWSSSVFVPDTTLSGRLNGPDRVDHMVAMGIGPGSGKSPLKQVRFSASVPCSQILSYPGRELYCVVEDSWGSQARPLFCIVTGRDGLRYFRSLGTLLHSTARNESISLIRLSPPSAAVQYSWPFPPSILDRNFDHMQEADESKCAGRRIAFDLRKGGALRGEGPGQSRSDQIRGNTCILVTRNN